MGSLGSDPKKNTLLVYGHLDVQPALKEDGWDYEPFVLTKDGDKLYGRGSTDDKGPVLGWLHVIQAFQVSTHWSRMFSEVAFEFFILLRSHDFFLFSYSTFIFKLELFHTI